MKKKIIIILCILIALALLVPVPMRLKDGGTVRYNAVLYQVDDVHTLNPDIDSEQEFIEGIIVKILGIEIYNNTK